MRGSSLFRSRAAAGLLGAGAVAAALGALSAPTEAKTDSRVYALKGKKKVLGYTPQEWAVQWWQWVQSIPASVNPLLDTTGEFTEVGQRGPVWFLSGIFVESGVAVRTATIPAGKALFFPVLNVIWDNLGYAEPYTAEELAALASESVGSYDLGSLQVRLDGNDIQGVAGMRVAAGPFAYWLPDGSTSEVLSGGAYTKGIYFPTVTDGYWTMLRPLPVGQHTLHFGGSTGGATPFVVDVTYYLTVVESNRP